MKRSKEVGHKCVFMQKLLSCGQHRCHSIRELYFSKADVPPLTIAANRPTLNKQREHFTAFYTLLPFSIPPFQICTKLYYLNMKEAEIYHFLIIFDWVWYFRIFFKFSKSLSSQLVSGVNGKMQRRAVEAVAEELSSRQESANTSRWFCSVFFFVSSDRSSYSDNDLLYIRSSGSSNFFRFSLSPSMQLMNARVTLSRLNSINAIDVTRVTRDIEYPLVH